MTQEYRDMLSFSSAVLFVYFFNSRILSFRIDPLGQTFTLNKKITGGFVFTGSKLHSINRKKQFIFNVL